MTRDRSIYLSRKTYWLLLTIVKAANSKRSEADRNVSIEDVLESIVTGWTQTHHPKLFELWDKREAIDAEAEKLI